MIKSLGDSEYTHSIDIGGGSLEMNLREIYILDTSRVANHA